MQQHTAKNGGGGGAAHSKRSEPPGMANEHPLLWSWLGDNNGSSNASNGSGWPACPQIQNCSSDHRSFDIGRVPSYLAIVSSAFSCVGSLLIVLVYLAFRDLRSGAQKIITFLAIADFVSAAGYIVGSANFLTFFNQTESCNVFQGLCRVQATVTSWFSLASFAWTVILAFYFYMVIVYNKRTVAAKLMPLYHFLAWILPLFIIIPLTALNKLGYSPYAAANWCYVTSPNMSYVHGQRIIHQGDVIGFILLAGRFWEILTYCVSVFIYAHITLKLTRFVKRPRHYQSPTEQNSAVEISEKRLMYIPGLFIFLRMWGTIQFFYSLGVSDQNQNGCIPESVWIGFMLLGVLQAIGDPGQGWGNAILYIFLSSSIRQRYLQAIGHCFLKLANSNETQQAPNNRAPGSQESNQEHPPPAPRTAHRSVSPPRATATDTECGPTPGAEPDISSGDGQQQNGVVDTWSFT